MHYHGERRHDRRQWLPHNFRQWVYIGRWVNLYVPLGLMGDQYFNTGWENLSKISFTVMPRLILLTVAP